MIGQKSGQRNSDFASRDQSEILSENGVDKTDNYLERGWHCDRCHLELTAIEKELYGDMCVFHTDMGVRGYPLAKSLYRAWLDWNIYRLLIRFRGKFGDTSFYFITGVLAILGLQHIGAAYSIRLKRLLIKEIKGVIKNVTERQIQKLRGSS